MAAIVGLVRTDTDPVQLAMTYYEHGTLLLLLRNYKASRDAMRDTDSDAARQSAHVEWSRSQAGRGGSRGFCGRVQIYSCSRSK